MTDIDDRELMLHYYGESERPTEIDRELERSAELRERYRELESVLDAAAVVAAPEPELEYGSRLWRKLEPRIAAAGRPRRDWLGPFFDRRWAAAAAALLLLAIGVLAGRFSAPPAPEVTAPAMTAGQQILRNTVAGHLQRTEILLRELANGPSDVELDFTVERELAAELNRANRLYRQAARNQGHRRTVALLDDLELLLLEVAHASDLISPQELANIRRRLDEGDLLFKVQVVGASLRRLPEAGIRTSAPSPTEKDA